MGNKKGYQRVPLPSVRPVGDQAYIREQQVVLKLRQSFGVSGVSAFLLCVLLQEARKLSNLGLSS